ncbi:YciI family protein [Amycolatopsis sp. 195334CR]|uniref:YciI family protein n=1 Tax=Amycolatopsis sp. 195334CR TaxID=2814588 RepID=UPI001A8DC300|nr:YciI family protein [Amycolatopsis sp. 195334CR]MBN6037215.1 YciI family protein [Amycolatopsis sp. 195334CR]
MRFMILMKSDERTEAGEAAGEAELAAMYSYNEQLVKAGVLLGGEGLHSSARGTRVTLTADETVVEHGPFPQPRELVAGFWLIQVKSREEAIAWARRCPAPSEGQAVLELRQVVEAEDFGEALTPELREANERLREMTLS